MIRWTRGIAFSAFGVAAMMLMPSPAAAQVRVGVVVGAPFVAAPVVVAPRVVATVTPYYPHGPYSYGLYYPSAYSYPYSYAYPYVSGYPYAYGYPYGGGYYGLSFSFGPSYAWRSYGYRGGSYRGGSYRSGGRRR